MNKLELFNEICLLGMGYHLILFTAFVSSSEAQYNVGWSIIFLTLLIIFVNLLAILTVTVINAVAVTRRACLKRKAKKARIYQ